MAAASPQRSLRSGNGGGVLEHPEASAAWAAHGLTAPPRHGGWIAADWPAGTGWTCCVEQGAYGHRARKATWLYASGVSLAPLLWGASVATSKLDEGFHTAAERKAWKAAHPGAARTHQRLTTEENLATPAAFRDLLISLARNEARVAAAVG